MKKCIIMLLMSFCFEQAFSQNKNIFVDDSSFVDYKNETLFYDEYPFILKDSLPNGSYTLYNFLKKDSTLINADKIIMQGTYSNFLKNGLFIYYAGEQSGKNHILKKYNYKDGLFEGIQTEFNEFNYIVSLYHNGKKEGYELLFQKVFEKEKIKWTLKSVENYSNDSLVDWVIFYQDGMIYRAGTGQVMKDSCEVVEYDNDGSILFKYYFQNGFLLCLDEYNNSIIAKRIIFKIVNSTQSKNIVFYSNSDFVVLNINPENGMTINYDSFGNIINTVNYMNGIPQR